MPQNSRDYQTRITGKTDEAWVQHGVKFDGMKDGVLIETKADYAQFIDSKTGEFKKWFSGKEDLVNQAKRQLNASDNARIEWYFNEKDAMEVVEQLFAERGIEGINLIFYP